MLFYTQNAFNYSGEHGNKSKLPKEQICTKTTFYLRSILHE